MKREEAIEIIRKNMPSDKSLPVYEALHSLIPELTESEDERILASIADCVGLMGEDGNVFSNHNVTKVQVLAWLEKQKEQKKPTLDDPDLYGDWDNDLLEEIHSWFGHLDGKYTPYTIDDIKLTARHFVEWQKQKEHQNNSDAPNESSWSGMISSSDKDKDLDEIAQDYVGRVKEYNSEPTWDLMQTAVCYGYYIAEQKEQKPEELVYRLNGMMQQFIKEGKDEEEQEHRLKCYKLFWNALEDSDYFEQEEQKPAEVDESTKRLNDNWMKQHFDDYKEQKPEWSEEDERNIRNLESVLYYDKYLSDETRTELGNFLKSLPNRLNRQPKTEWSEEDERMLKWIEDILLIADNDLSDKLNGKVSPITDSAYSSMKLCIAKCLSWLKFLRPSWKPSEHQMNILKAVKDYVGKGSGYWGEGLGSLIEDLEKLM